jgi:predicted nucleic acid-binding protein
MRRVFGDSFYFFALANARDQAHDKAVDFLTTFSGRLITTGWVLTEVGDGLAHPANRSAFLQLVATLRAEPNVHVIPCSDELLEAGIELYRQRPDKSWSLTDCISFVVMQREEIMEALTGDHHFEQAGFVALLK